jgi:hypothetical protein
MPPGVEKSSVERGRGNHPVKRPAGASGRPFIRVAATLLEWERWILHQSSARVRSTRYAVRPDSPGGHQHRARLGISTLATRTHIVPENHAGVNPYFAGGCPPHFNPWDNRLDSRSPASFELSHVTDPLSGVKKTPEFKNVTPTAQPLADCLEMLSAVEVAHREFRGACGQLGRLNKALRQRHRELGTRLTKLARAIARRKEAPESLQKSELMFRLNGRAFALPAPANPAERQPLGLLGMQERVRLVNGQFAIESVPKRGTTVRVEIPLPHPSPASTTAHRESVPLASN